jgi:cytoskeletal protein RodZ
MSLGKDLSSIRKSQNLTLEDIQNAVKIPIDTLQSIESNRIFADLDTNNTYIRSFVRSYAKVLKINDANIVQALDEVENGTYDGSILIDDSDSAEEAALLKEEKEKRKSDTPIAVEPPLSEKNLTPSTIPTSESDSIEWANLNKNFQPASKPSRMWIILACVALIIVIGGLGYYFWGGTPQPVEQTAEPLIEQETIDDDNQNQTAIPPTPVDSTAATEDVQQQQEPAEEENTVEKSTRVTELGDTLTVTLYAAYGQLEPVRVTSDLNWTTNPFWIEEGLAYNFDFQDTLLVRGQYSRLLLLFNDHVIENPRQNHFDDSLNSILITRDVVDQPQYLAPAPQEFPLEVGAPDSTFYRIRF